MIRRIANTVIEEIHHHHRSPPEKIPVSLKVAARVEGEGFFQKKYVAFKKT